MSTDQIHEDEPTPEYIVSLRRVLDTRMDVGQEVAALLGQTIDEHDDLFGATLTTGVVEAHIVIEADRRLAAEERERRRARIS